MQQNNQQKERNDLLNKLDGKLTHTQILYSTVDQLRKIYNATKSFKNNYYDIKEANTKNADKYFHAKANCQAAQYGNTGATIARKLSNLREDTDLIKNKYKKKNDGTKMKPSEIITDYRDDNYANLYGRQQGLNNPNGNCKDLINKYRPRGLNEKY